MSSDVWKPEKGWCAVYAILELAKLHDFVTPKISSDEDLSKLRQEWEKLLLFTKYDRDSWPSMRRVFALSVLKYVYKLQVIEICQCRFMRFKGLRKIPRASTFQQRLKHRSLRQLAEFKTFKKLDGVGILFCTNIRSVHSYHAMFFKIEQTNVLFFDTYGTSRDACWVDKGMEQWIVDAVYLVKPVAIE